MHSYRGHIFASCDTSFQKVSSVDTVTERFYSDVVLETNILNELEIVENITWDEGCPELDFSFNNRSLNPLDVRICMSMQTCYKEFNSYNLHSNERIKKKISNVYY